MPALLEIYYHDQPIQEHVCKETDVYRIGREMHCEIALTGTTVSREHAQLLFRNGCWYVDDLDSKNGSYVNGNRITQHPLEGICWISFGDITCRFESLAEEQLEQREQFKLKRQQTLAFWKVMTKPPQLPYLLQDTLAMVCQLVGTQRAFIVSESSGQVKVLASYPEKNIPFDGSVSALKLANQHQEPIITVDIANERALASKTSVVQSGIRTLAVYPLQTNHPSSTLVYTDSRCVGSVFTQLDYDLLKGVCEQLELLLQADSILQQLEALIGNEYQQLLTTDNASP